MGKIERVPFPVSGTNDTVETLTDCGVAKLKTGLDGRTKVKGTPDKSRCKLIASKDRGLFGVMVGGQKFLVSVRLEEAKELMKAAEEAYSNVEAGEEGADVQEGSSPQR